MARYEIQWLNDGPGATGFVGWTPDGIGDANQFVDEADALGMMAEIEQEARLQGEAVRQYRVARIEEEAR